MEIKQTGRLDQFKLLNENRDVYDAHVGRLKKSMEETGKNFTAMSPIIVNSDMQVLDGQHRLAALKELGWPAYYIVVDGDINDARDMNILHRGWRPLDYAKSYANNGQRSYKNFLELNESFPKISATIIMSYSYGNKVPGLSAMFRKGQFELADENMDLVVSRLQKLEDVLAVVPILRHSAEMAHAILSMITNESYNHERFMTKLKTVSQYKELIPATRRSDNLRMLEDIYNYKTKTNTVRFF